MTNGDSFLLLGIEIVNQAQNLGPKNILMISPDVREISEKKLTFAAHIEQLAKSDKEVVRTDLFVVSTEVSTFKTYFLPLHSLTALRNEDRTFNDKYLMVRLQDDLRRNSMDLLTFISMTW